MRPQPERLACRQTLLERELARVVQTLREMNAQRITLFGSVGRREIGAWSDLDLIVVLPSDLPFIWCLKWLYERIQPRVGLDLPAYAPQEFETLRERPFLRRTLQEGRVLYEA